MSEWQPIETVPKDGSGFLACFLKANGFFMIDTVSYERGRIVGKMRDVPWTHWMPLPPPPKDIQEGTR